MPYETLAWQGETRPDGWRCEGAWSGGEQGEFLVRIYDAAGQLVQECALAAESRMMPTGQAHWADVDFDGAEDVLVCLGGARGGQVFYAALLWDEASGAYREEPSFAQISSPAADMEHQVIWGGYEVSSVTAVDAYICREGVFVRAHSLWAGPLDPADRDRGVLYTEYALTEEGELAVVNHLGIPGGAAAWEPAAYAEAGPVWEGWDWCPFETFHVPG